MNRMLHCCVFVMMSVSLSMDCYGVAQQPIASISGTSSDRKVVFVEKGTTEIKEKSLAPAPAMAARQNAYGGSDLGEEMPTGATYYKFILDSKERLKLQLTCENHGKVFMQFVVPRINTPMTSQYRRANQSPKALRSSSIEITNITNSQCEVILALYGAPNYAYNISVKRSF